MGSTYPSLECSGASVIASRLRSLSGGRVLDVATGSGGFIRVLLKTLKDCEISPAYEPVVIEPVYIYWLLFLPPKRSVG
jgi:hypothetical protein